MGAGKCILAGELVKTARIPGSSFRSAGRKPFHNFPNFASSAREFRPVDELASPDGLWYRWAEAIEWASQGPGSLPSCSPAAVSCGAVLGV
jgi:hypothetical protein